MTVTCEQFANDATTTLASNVLVTDTVIHVTSITNFPALAPFRIMIDQEIMYVTAGQLTTTWNVSRGLENTTITTHSAGASISQIFTQQSFNAWSSCRFATDTRANLPAAGTAGRLFLTQGPGLYLYKDNGAQWNAWGPTFLFNEYDFLANTDQTTYLPYWNWVNDNDGTNPPVGITQDLGSLSIGVGPNVAPGENMRLFVELVSEEAPVAAPYQVTVAFTPLLYPTDQTCCGIVFMDSASGKFIVYRIMYYAGNGFCNTDLVMSLDKYTNFHTFNSNYKAVSAATFISPVIFFQMQDDGVNLNWYFSNDGFNFIRFDLHARTDFLPSGPDTIGLAIGTNNTTGSAGMNVYSWLKVV